MSNRNEQFHPFVRRTISACLVASMASINSEKHQFPKFNQPLHNSQMNTCSTLSYISAGHRKYKELKYAFKFPPENFVEGECVAHPNQKLTNAVLHKKGFLWHMPLWACGAVGGDADCRTHLIPGSWFSHPSQRGLPSLRGVPGCLGKIN